MNLEKVKKKIRGGTAPLLGVVLAAALGLGLSFKADAPAARPAPKPVPVGITDQDLKSLAGPKTDDMAKGDPGADTTGTINDVAVSNTTTGMTLGDMVNQVGQNRIAINFVWTLVTGFLVMFMQAGFAIVETGLTRAKSANHTMMMNFMVYGIGLFSYWVCGFAIQMGGCAPVANLGGTYALNTEKVINFLSYGGKPVPWGLFGQKGFFLAGT